MQLLSIVLLVSCTQTGPTPTKPAQPTGPWTATAVDTVTRQLDGGDGLVLAADGTLRVGEPAWNRVRTLDPDSGTLGLFVDQLNEPYGLALQADGDILVANWAARNALEVSADGQTAELASTDDRFGNIYVDPTDDAVYLPAFHTGVLERLTPDGTREQVSVGQQGDGLHAVMHDDQRRLYTGYVLTGEIYRHTSNGTPTLWATLPGRLGNLLWFDGQMLATGWDTHQVYTINEAGDVAVFAGTGDPGRGDGPVEGARFENPNGLVYDPDREALFVSESIGRVRRISLERSNAG